MKGGNDVIRQFARGLDASGRSLEEVGDTVGTRDPSHLVVMPDASSIHRNASAFAGNSAFAGKGCAAICQS